MKMKLAVLGVGVLLSCVAGAAEGVFEIARGRKAEVSICVAEGAVGSAKFAAEELAKYLGEMSGAKFEVVTGKASGKCICVGEKYESEREEEICLRVEKDGQVLTVTGEGPRGPVYAVYTLLMRLGCGFWTPMRTSVPKKDVVAVAGDLNVVEAPAFVVRQSAGASAWENPEWEVRLRLNGVMSSPTKISEAMGGARQYDLSQCKMDLERDGMLFATHPEWYALRGKKRSMQHLCNTNPGVREEIVRRVRERLEKEPGIRQIALGLNDGAEFCLCAECSKLRKEEGGQIGPELDLCNYVARQFAKDWPKVRFLVFAYEASLRPPKTMTCEENVDVCVAYIQRNYAREPSQTKNHNSIVGEWSKLTHGNVYIWGYNAQFKDYQIPWPIVDTLGGEMRTYRDLGVKGVFIQMADDPNSDFQTLRCWLAAQMMWKPDQDEWKLIEEWCDGACGKGGKYVFEWLKICRGAREGVKMLGVYMGDPRTWFKAEDILKGYELLTKAEEATKDDPTAALEVKRIRNTILHTMLLAYYSDIASAAKKAGIEIPSRMEILKTLVAAKIGSWREGNAWYSSFLPRARHGQLLLEKPGVLIPKTGEWTFRNPMTTGTKEDPFITYDRAAKCYYRILTVGNEFRIRRAKKMVDLFEAKCEEKVLWKANGEGGIATNLRGPELIRGRDGVWRIWACGGEEALVLEGEEADDVAVNRMFILEGGKDPFVDGFRFRGTICSKEIAADPTVFTMPNGKTYLFYTREQGRSGLVVRELAAENKPSEKGSVILPAKKWTELALSPTLVQMGKDVYLLYGVGGRTSAKAEIRALRYVGGDVLRRTSWEQCKEPVIRSGHACYDVRDARLMGPRAPAVFRSADGSEAWIAFRGWATGKPLDEEKDSLMCVQRLDDGLSNEALLFGTAAELTFLVLQPSGDVER
jgi:hypothetical protein